MTAEVAARELDAELAEALRRACGLTLQGSLERALARRLGPAGSAEIRARIRRGDAGALTDLVESALVQETYFFRYPEQLAALSRLAFRSAAGAAPLRIWSAGCASGEEPYSIAAALIEAGRPAGADRILATDVSRRALDAARAGRYGGWSLRRPPASGEARWLLPREGGFEIAPEVRASVEFRVHNLLDPPPSTSFDVVLCRNVLIYFDAPLAREVLARLASTLRPGGWLAVAPAELGLATGLPLEPHREDGAILLRRVAAAVPAEAPLRDGPRKAARKAGTGRRGSRSSPTATATTTSAGIPPPPSPPRSGGEGPGVPAGADPSPELRFVRLAFDAESRGDVPAAIDALRRALYLDPELAVAHATLLALYRRTGRPADAERARRNALRVLEGLDDAAVLRGPEPVTAGALRSALEPTGRGAGPPRAPRRTGAGHGSSRG